MKRIKVLTVFLVHFLLLNALAYGLVGIPQTINTPEALTKWLSAEFRYRLEIIDEWQTPEETISSREGDCEDFAVLVSSMLTGMEIESNIAIIEFSGLDSSHAICIWKDEYGQYNFTSNKTLYRTGKENITSAIQAYYPDWSRIVFTDEKGKELKSLKRRS